MARLNPVLVLKTLGIMRGGPDMRVTKVKGREGWHLMATIDGKKVWRRLEGASYAEASRRAYQVQADEIAERRRRSQPITLESLQRDTLEGSGGGPRYEHDTGNDVHLDQNRPAIPGIIGNLNNVAR